MNLRLVTRVLLNIGLSCPPAILLFLVLYAKDVQNLDYLWLTPLSLLLLLINLAYFVFLSGVFSAMQTEREKSEGERDQLNQVLETNTQRNSFLLKENDRLRGVAEIHNASQVEDFSDLLKNFFSIIHSATEARSITIFLEDSSLPGLPRVKAHMLWTPERRGGGQLFAFFNQKLQSEGSETLSGFEGRNLAARPEVGAGHYRAELFYQNIPVGFVIYTSIHAQDERVLVEKELARLIESMEITTEGLCSCYEKRSSQIMPCAEDLIEISVPVLNQGTLIGVLVARLQQQNTTKSFDPRPLEQQKNDLLEYGKNIGHHIVKEELYEKATRDSLTGLFNRSHYNNQMESMFHKMLRYHREFSMIFLDIDHFKSINDTYGHITGDMALKGLGVILLNNVRKTDMAFRLGGEELVLLLTETPLSEAVQVAEKLRQVIESSEFPKEGGGTIRFTASIGVASLEEGVRDPAELLARSDRAMYCAKHGGRNRVISYNDVAEIEKEALREE